tara:strand:+ start:1811 stop:2401 length:591 start_codon:yes stop_codon:yes gene_type:complete
VATTQTEANDPARKLYALEFMTMDGVVESPHEWHFPYYSDELGAAVGEAQEGFDALLLGRGTYEGFAAAWPDRPDDEPGAKEMNGAHHYLVSNTVTEGPWEPTTVVSGDRAAIVQQIRELKAQPGGPIVTWGSPPLVTMLLEENLLDELRLFVDPLVLGKGKRLFESESRLPMRLVRSTPLPKGALYLQYAPDDGA